MSKLRKNMIARQLVCDEAQAGLYVQPENAEALAGAISMLADDPAQRARMGLNGRTWVLAHATRELLASTYLELLERLVAAAVSRPMSS